MMLLENNFSLLTLAASYAAVAWAPGPNVLLVSRSGVLGRPVGAAAALGIATGAALLAGLILASLPAFAAPMEGGIALAFLYGVVLLRAGLCCLPLFRWKCAPTPHAADGLLGHFRAGVTTGLTNPLTAAFFVGASAGFMGENPALPPFAGAATAFCMALAWFGTLGLVLSGFIWREWYERARPLANAGVGLLLLAIGWSEMVDAGTRWAGI